MNELNLNGDGDGLEPENEPEKNPWLHHNTQKKSRNFRFLEPGFYYQKSKFSFSLMKYIVISAYFKNDIFQSVKFRDFFSLL